MCEYDKKAVYVTYDLTGQVRQGRNAIGILLGNGPFFAYRKKVPTDFRNFGLPRALLNLRLEFEDGSTQDIVTDSDWKVTTAGPLRANNEYDGEIFDARMEQRGWDEPSFDDSGWRAASIMDPPGGRLVAMKREPMRVTESLRPVSIAEPQPGVWVVDFGQTYNGWVRLKVSGPSGTEVRFRRGGMLRDDGLIRPQDSRSALMTDIYILRGGGEEVWTPRLTSQGGRYLQVTGFPGRPAAENFEGLVLHNDMERTGAFECSSGLINRLCENMRWSQRIEARGVPLDISSRDERMPWISEHHGMDGHAYLYNVAAMYTNWVEDIRVAQRPDGSVGNVAPAFWPFGAGVVWPSTLIYLPHWFRLFYGDDRVIERSYSAMKRFVRWVRDRHLKADGTIDFNDHGDWLDATTMDGKIPDDGRQHPLMGATYQPLISSAFYYWYCRLLESHARRMRRGGDAADFSALGDKVREGFNRRFFDPAANTYQSRTQTSYVLPLAFGLVPEDRRAAVVENLARDVMVTHKGHTTVGFMGVQWILTVLSENGQHEAAYSIMTRKERPSWGYMVSKGATTMWERWNHDTADPGMTGESQYFLGADIVGWLFRSLAGINVDPERPGFRHLILRPLPVGDLRWVKASFRSMYGLIASHWEVAGGKLTWNVTVPPNTTATAWVPTTDPDSVTESGKPARAAEGVRFERAENRAAVFELKSGTYRFEAKSG
jgi:alpha-L-rhamnosidase